MWSEPLPGFPCQIGARTHELKASPTSGQEVRKGMQPIGIPRGRLSNALGMVVGIVQVTLVA